MSWAAKFQGGETPDGEVHTPFSIIGGNNQLDFTVMGRWVLFAILMYSSSQRGDNMRFVWCLRFVTFYCPAIGFSEEKREYSLFPREMGLFPFEITRSNN